MSWFRGFSPRRQHTGQQQPHSPTGGYTPVSPTDPYGGYPPSASSAGSSHHPHHHPYSAPPSASYHPSQPPPHPGYPGPYMGATSSHPTSPTRPDEAYYAPYTGHQQRPAPPARYQPAPGDYYDYPGESPGGGYGAPAPDGYANIPRAQYQAPPPPAGAGYPTDGYGPYEGAYAPQPHPPQRKSRSQQQRQQQQQQQQQRPGRTDILPEYCPFPPALGKLFTKIRTDLDRLEEETMRFRSYVESLPDPKSAQAADLDEAVINSAYKEYLRLFELPQRHLAALDEVDLQQAGGLAEAARAARRELINYSNTVLDHVESLKPTVFELRQIVQSASNSPNPTPAANGPASSSSLQASDGSSSSSGSVD
ncbi:hypothetical protein H696_05930 [Fonticula alba]|uniref:BAG domain-containing protein n=1 Tax=Fonticula alba TaxID=691883 RepID=A0A058Z132_FONAL|nr:hypothetical protein H696_05930 [Fonticula alba]KCV67643.1 hypothetical protein H696_05930 [Fonticula alba]|eukprot:XP_009497981.1 hypothetical protein H696_05930 [Fonticula alba]